VVNRANDFEDVFELQFEEELGMEHEQGQERRRSAPRVQGRALSRTVTMEPLVISVSPRRMEALLRRAGWVPVDIQFGIKNFNDEDLVGYTSFLQFTGPRGESRARRADVRAGVATFPRFWLKPRGSLRLLVVHLGRPANRPTLYGSAFIPEQVRSRYLAFSAVQDHRNVQVRAETMQQANEQLQVGGHAGVNILKAVELGGRVTSTQGQTQTTSRGVVVDARVGLPNLTITLVRR